MTFYSSISAYYDEIFPVDANEMAFVRKQLDDCTSGCKNLLDIGCGSGNKTELLAGNGRKIIAIDGDAGMIEEAKKNHTRPDIEYLSLDMTKIAQAFKPESFDALLCLGNTLVHLPGPEDIARLLAEMGGILKPGGLAVIQILNYDRILDKMLHALPQLETDKLKFTRYYDLQNCRMLFVTKLLVKETGQEINNSIPLYPLRKNELNFMLGEAGFLEVKHYGSYSGEPLTDDSFPLIAVARKA